MASALWPYEEVQFTVVNQNKGQFSLKTPWVASRFEVAPNSPESVAVCEWINHQDNIDHSHLSGLWSVLAGLQSLPIAYELPRTEDTFGGDAHKIKKNFRAQSPQSLAKDLQLQHPSKFSSEWTWDAESIEDFANCGDEKFDPLSVLSVARRFHYLDDDENKMNRVYDHIKNLKDGKTRKRSAAIVIRQNHFATDKCASSLQPAGEIAQSQTSLIEKFIRDEKSHNAILGNGIKAMQFKHSDLPLTESVQNLMQLLEKCAFYNFLAFCMSLDFFEKPQFKDQDALAEVLLKLGEATAARSLQAHKNINDHAEHEGFARTLLLKMNPVDGPYLRQALQFAELVSKSIIHVSHDLEKMIVT